MKKNKGGRPSVMTDEVIRKLEEAFLFGCSDLEACCFADISKSSLYDYCVANPEFSERKETLKNKPTMKAKRIIDKALDDSDLATAHKVIDRKEGAKIKQEISGPDGGPVQTTVLEFVPI
jgi:hypothetical protein